VAPIAVTLCFGLAFATFLVLLVIPALILLLEGGRNELGALAARLNLPRPGGPKTPTVLSNGVSS
jgi:Cu/Ag efflux pump CusA